MWRESSTLFILNWLGYWNESMKNGIENGRGHTWNALRMWQSTTLVWRTPWMGCMQSAQLLKLIKNKFNIFTTMIWTSEQMIITENKYITIHRFNIKYDTEHIRISDTQICNQCPGSSVDCARSRFGTAHLFRNFGARSPLHYTTGHQHPTLPWNLPTGSRS